MRKGNILTALSSAAICGLLFVGVGCTTAEKVADDALLPVTTSVGALNQAKDLTTRLQAKDAEEAERVSNEITVALIVTENASAPAGTRVLPDTIGCNDTVGFAKVSRETASGDTVHDALSTLFSVKDTSYAGMYNALAGSELMVDRILSHDGVTTDVELKGTIMSGGACDDPRIRAQVEETVRRFRPDFRILLNGSESEWRCFSDMSGECE